MVGFPRVIPAWICKFFAIPMPLTNGIPEATPLKQALIDPASIPEGARQIIHARMEELGAVGFIDSCFFAPRGSLMDGVGYGAVARHQSGEAIAKMIYAKFGTTENLALGFTTLLATGRVLATARHKAGLAHGAWVEVERQVGANVSELWNRHTERIARAKRDSAAVCMQNFDEVAAFDDDFIRRTCEFHVARGVWVPMSPSEVDALRQKRAASQGST